MLISSYPHSGDGYNLKVRFPNSGLLLLRDKEKAPDKAKIIIDTPEGSTSYSVNIIKVSDFNINEIFEKQLYFLIPFYIFNYEKQLKQIDKDAKSINSLAELYGEIVEKLNREHTRGFLSEFSYSVIIDLITRVLNKLASNQKNVQQKVSDTMGGKILMDIPVIREYHRGLDEGIEQGRIRALAQMLAKGGTEDDLRRFHDATEDEIVQAKERLAESQNVV